MNTGEVASTFDRVPLQPHSLFSGSVLIDDQSWKTSVFG